MHKNYKFLIIILTSLALVILFFIKEKPRDEKSIKNENVYSEAAIEWNSSIRLTLSKSLVFPGDKVNITTNQLKNYFFTKPGWAYEATDENGSCSFEIACDFTPGAQLVSSLLIPLNTEAGTYYLKLVNKSLQLSSPELGFVRVLKSGLVPLETFTIDQKNFSGLPIYCLDGGMSAEYSIEKSLASLSHGISHSWYTEKPGAGPRPVYSTPDFLSKSLLQTIKYYEDLGPNRIYDSVVVGTGVASAAYLTHVTESPFLPIHFLAASSSIHEIQFILDRAREEHISAYAVMGYDGSMNDMAVSWIKLLDLPQIYIDFMKRHKVKKVIFIGTQGIIGETLVSKIIAKDINNVSPGDIFIQHTSSSMTSFGYNQNFKINDLINSKNYGHDKIQHSRRLKDLDKHLLNQNIMRVSDWESGLEKSQINSLLETVKKEKIANEVMIVSSLDDGSAVSHLYDLATFLMRAYFEKNNIRIKGISANPYLVSQPLLDEYQGHLPLLFWQGINNDDFIHKLKSLIRKAKISEDQKLVIKMNLSKNFNMWMTNPNQLKNDISKSIKNAEIEFTDIQFDESWGENEVSASKKSAQNLIEELSKNPGLKTATKKLTLDDLERICKENHGLVSERIRLTE